MANDLGIRPMRIDTFTADVTIFSGPGDVNAIYANEVAGSAKQVVFIGDDGTEVFKFTVGANATAQITPAKPMHFSQGMIFDTSESGLAENDDLFIDLA